MIAALLKANRDAAKVWATDAASKATGHWCKMTRCMVQSSASRMIFVHRCRDIGLTKVVSDNGQLAMHMCAREAAWMAESNSYSDWHRPWPSSEAVCRLLIKAYPQVGVFCVNVAHSQ